jgi:hypothetical protein
VPYFDHLKRFCLFEATGRSGHSIIAHLLSAHPKVMICDELDAVSLFKEGYSREQVFALIKFQDYRHQRRHRQKGKYNYSIDGLWQGEYEKKPEVIGDAKGEATMRLLGGENDFLVNLRASLKMPLRIFMHLRNPFDTITTAIRKNNKTLQEGIKGFIELERIMMATMNRTHESERLVQRHEDIIANPDEHFTKMFVFLGVDPIPKVVNACAEKLWNKPKQTRNKVNWTKQEIERVEACMSQSLLFSPYLND